MTDSNDERELVCTTLVRLVVEVRLSQPWPGNATVEEVHRSAECEALQKVSHLDGHPFRIVGKPKVDIVTTRKAGKDGSA